MNQYIRPAYYNGFKCIASSCEDNCCMGWHVDIDKTTYMKYKRITSPDLKVVINKSLRRNPSVTSDEIDYATVKLTKDQNCAFLTNDHLCLVQKQLGESYLSNVCSAFPRIANRVNGTFQISLSPSCPEALRQYLFKVDGITFEKVNLKATPAFLSYNVTETLPEFKNTAVSELEKINKGCISILKDRRYSFEMRLYLLGKAINDIKMSYISQNNMKKQNGKKRKTQIGTEYFKHETLHTESTFRVNVLKTERMVQLIYQILDIENTVVSQRYLHFYNDSQKAWHNTRPSKGIKAFERFFNEYQQVFENYFVNLAFRNLFPFTEADDIFDAYILFFVRYLMMRHEIIGYAVDHPLEKEVVLAYFQSYSKAIEHHHYFYSDLVMALRQERYNKWQQIKVLFSADLEA